MKMQIIVIYEAQIDFDMKLNNLFLKKKGYLWFI